MDEIVKGLLTRLAEIEASDAPVTPDDVTALRRWKGELEEATKRIADLLADVEQDTN